MVDFLKKTLFSRRAWFWHAASHIDTVSSVDTGGGGAFIRDNTVCDTYIQ